VECPQCRRVTNLPDGVDGLVVNFATADVLAALGEDACGEQQGFSWPGDANQWMAQAHRKKPPTPPWEAREGRKTGHRRSLSCPGPLNDLEAHADEVMAMGDGWHAVYKTPARNASKTPTMSPSLFGREGPAIPILDEDEGTRSRSQTAASGGSQAGSYSSAHSFGSAQSPPDTRDLLWMAAQQSLEVAEARQAMELAEGSPTFQSVRARYAPGSDAVHLAAPVSMSRTNTGNISENLLQSNSELAQDIAHEESMGRFQPYGLEGPPDPASGEPAEVVNSHRAAEPRNRLVWQARARSASNDSTGSVPLPHERRPQGGRHGDRGGECCVGNSGWTQVLTWMGLLSLDIG